MLMCIRRGMGNGAIAATADSIRRHAHTRNVEFAEMQLWQGERGRESDC